LRDAHRDSLADLLALSDELLAALDGLLVLLDGALSLLDRAFALLDDLGVGVPEDEPKTHRQGKRDPGKKTRVLELKVPVEEIVFHAPPVATVTSVRR